MTKDTKFRMVDFFAGMGGFSMGFEKAGGVCVYAVEYDKHKRQIFKIIHGYEPQASDIRRLEARDIPDAECWCFGAPCTSFSLSGKRTGLRGESGLIQEVFRLLGEKEAETRPEWLIYENVKGMLSSNRGWDFAAILAAMDDLGYDCQWNLCNNKDLGVPQNRERIYTVGHFRTRGNNSRKIFPIGEDYLKIGQPERYDLRGFDTANTHTDDGDAGTVCQHDNSQDIREVLGRNLSGRRQDNEGERFPQEVIQLAMVDSHRNNPNQYRVYDKHGIAPALTKAEGGGRIPYIIMDKLYEGKNDADS